MLSMAIAYAISNGAGTVYYGAHSGDHAIYPDCRPQFVDRMNAVANVCHYFPVTIEAPYLHITKADILKEGLQLKVDYGKTWTCYKGGVKACGKCGSCTERLEAFAINHVKDPLEYEK
jgi:7-cyano-7-deazaguanine synthase